MIRNPVQYLFGSRVFGLCHRWHGEGFYATDIDLGGYIGKHGKYLIEASTMEPSQKRKKAPALNWQGVPTVWVQHEEFECKPGESWDAVYARLQVFANRDDVILDWGSSEGEAGRGGVPRCGRTFSAVGV